MNNLNWHFPTLRPCDAPSDPSNDEWARESLAEEFTTILRESIQNSLDVHDDKTTPVIFRCTIAKPNPTTIDFINKTVNTSYSDHYEASFQKPLPALHSDSTVILLEDENTTGITGQVDCYTPDPNNKFYNYFRMDRGVRSKQGPGQLGNRGVGKTSFNEFSSYGYCLTSTTRKAENNPLFMGTSLLITHADKNKQWYKHRGLFGISTNIDAPAHPEKDIAANQIHKNCDFRRNPQTSGTSHLIPRTSSLKLQTTELLQIILDEFAYAISKERLIIHLENEGDKHQIAPQTLQTIISKLPSGPEKDRIQHIIEVTSQTHTPCVLAIKKKQVHKALQELIDTKQLDQVKADYANSHQAHFQLDFDHLTSGKVQGSWFIHFTPKTESQVKAFFRNVLPITKEPARCQNTNVIIEVSCPQIFQTGVYTFDQILQNAEDVAHTDFIATRSQFQKAFKDYAYLLSFAKVFPAALAAHLQPDITTMGSTFLNKVFPSNKTSPRPKPTPTPEPIVKIKKYWKIEEKQEPTRGSVLIQSTSNFTTAQVGLKLKATFHIATLNGPKYHPRDFNLKAQSHFTITTSNTARWVATDTNQIEITPTTTNWRVKVSGFELNRNVITTVSEAT